MLQEQLKTIKEKKIDAEDMAKVLQRLPEAERQKIFYMIQGVELIYNNASMPKQKEVC